MLGENLVQRWLEHMHGALDAHPEDQRPTHVVPVAHFGEPAIEPAEFESPVVTEVESDE